MECLMNTRYNGRNRAPNITTNLRQQIKVCAAFQIRVWGTYGARMGHVWGTPHTRIPALFFLVFIILLCAIFLHLSYSLEYSCIRGTHDTRL